jgi:aspartate/tyrosine/aromatic aminotransferase
LKILVRTNYSSPSIHGARIAGRILTNPENRKQWLMEL